MGTSWASDFPRADHTPEYIHDLNELVAMFPAEHQRDFIGDNAAACSASSEPRPAESAPR